MKHHITQKSVFLHLFFIAMLYASLVALLTVLFQYINFLYPDPLESGYYVRASIYSGINWGSAVLIIAFPALVIVSVFIEKELRKHTELRESPERKWLLYLTQFVTALIIVISLMTLVYNFYGGALNMRFGLKVLAALIVAAAMLGYYRWELVRSGKPSRVPMIAASVAGLCVVLILIAAFVIGASPMNQRAEKFDQQRMDDLSSLQGQVISFWQAKKTLPKNLTDLNNTLQGYTIPKDPNTNQSYEYNVKGDLEFELCATFGTKSYNYDEEKAAGNVVDSRSTATTDPKTMESQFVSSVAPYDPYQTWLHTAGRYCFTRTIDPDFYKTLESSTTTTTSVVE